MWKHPNSNDAGHHPESPYHPADDSEAAILIEGFRTEAECRDYMTVMDIGIIQKIMNELLPFYFIDTEPESE